RCECESHLRTISRRDVRSDGRRDSGSTCGHPGLCDEAQLVEQYSSADASLDSVFLLRGIDGNVTATQVPLNQLAWSFGRWAVTASASCLDDDLIARFQRIAFTLVNNFFCT